MLGFNRITSARLPQHLFLTTPIICASGGIVHAQSAQGTVDEVVAIGSRVIKDGNASPTPLTVIGAEQLQDSAPTGVADALAEIPETIGNARPSSALSPIGPTGSFLNLRSLGQSRTVVIRGQF